MYILKNTYFCENYKDMNRIIISLLVLTLISCNKEIEILPIQKTPTFEYQGFNLGVWCKSCGDVTSNRVEILLDSMKNIGSNTVTIDFGVMIDNSGKVIPNGIYEPNLSDIKNIIILSKNKGFKVVVKPHTITDNSTNNRMIYNTSDTTNYNKNIIDEWKNYLVNMVKNLGGSNFDVLCLGTEMDMVDTKRRDEWVLLIDEVKKVYSGKLTYDAVFNRWKGNPDVNEVVFWDKLDFIGVSLYVPLSDKPTPTLDELKSNWDNANNTNPEYINDITGYLNGISTQYGKKIYVLESGYKSSINSLSEPSNLPIKTNSPYYELQSMGIDVLLGKLSTNTNIKGVSIWGTNTTYFSEKDKEWDFVTFGKPANILIKKYFGIY